MKRALCAAALILAGCVEPRYKIGFESIPPGAIVRYNKEFVGAAPCELEISGHGNRTFKGGNIPWLYDSFTAEPAEPSPELFPQKVAFRRSGILVPGEKIPEKIMFDLRKPPAVEERESGSPGTNSAERVSR